MEFVRMLKFVWLVVGIVLVMVAKIKYQRRTASNPDKSTPYNQKEKKMINTGYGFCILAIVFVVLFN